MRVVFYMGFHFTHVIHVHIERCIISVQYLFDCQTAHFTFQQINLIIPTLFFWCCILLCSVWARCSLGTYCLHNYIIHSSCCPRIDELKGTMLLFIILQFSLQVYLFGLLSWVTDDEYNWLWWHFFIFYFLVEEFAHGSCKVSVLYCRFICISFWVVAVRICPCMVGWVQVLSVWICII